MRVMILRENANAVSEKGVFYFHGAAGREYFNAQRTTPLMPPKKDLEIKDKPIYKIHSGIAYELPYGAPQAHLPDVRPTGKYWSLYGVHVERVDFEAVAPGILELIVYISANSPFVLNSSERMFESFAFGDIEIELFSGELPTRTEGFVPVAKKQIQDAGSKRNQQAAMPGELSDEDKRKKMAAWLDSDDKPGQTIAPGAPAGAIPAQSSFPAPQTPTKVVEPGGVRGMSDQT